MNLSFENLIEIISLVIFFLDSTAYLRTIKIIKVVWHYSKSACIYILRLIKSKLK